MTVNVAFINIIVTVKNLTTFLSNQSICFYLNFNYLNKFSQIKAQKEKTQKKKENVDYAASEIYNELLRTCFEDYCYDLPVAEKALDHKYKPKTLFLEAYDYKP